jgi:hypothetical protein
MKLKYKILWIEDEKSSIKIKAKNIRKYLEDDYGFECLESDITILDYEEFVEDYIDDNELKSCSDIEKYDLLLVDFNLGEEEHTGDKLIQIIRDNNIYSEILFYSSDLDSLIDKLNQHFIDGVFTSVRDELENKVKKLIKVTIKKVQDVNNLRGLIMAEVAELDRMKERIIIKASVKIPEKSIEKYTLKKVKESGNSNKNKAQRYLDDLDSVTFESLFSFVGFIDSDKKAKATGEILNKLNITEPVTKDDFIQPYIDDILGKRNKFAHIEECDGDDGQGNSCKVIGDIPFTEENCIEIRKEIKKYKDILKEIETKIDE